MLSLSARNRIDKSTWPHVALGRVNTTKEIIRVRKWIRENGIGEHELKLIKETVGTRRRTIATFIRFRNSEDALVFTLAWNDYL